MRLVATFLLCGVALTTGAAEIWRWKDANGVTHYSDQPRPGAELIMVDAPRPSGDSSPPPVPVPETDGTVTERPPPPFTYARCTVAEPVHDQTFHGVQPVSVRLTIEPALQPGHRIQLFVNGAARSDWPANAIEYTLPEVFRGSHTLSVRIVDEQGRPACSGPSSTFHLRQPSVLSPLRQGQSGA
jgi:hypothetical protein